MTSTEVPGRFPIALNGRPLMIDVQSDQWKHVSAPMMRQTQDSGVEPSESLLSPDGLWRRSQDSWHFGAGQTFRDRDDTNRSMFRASKGIDVWTKYEFTLLPDTDQKLSSAASNLLMVVAGDRLYVADGANLKYTTDITVDTPTWTTVSASSGSTITGLASDGYTVWYSSNGGTNTYSTNTSTNVGAPYFGTPFDLELLAYTKGRLMGSYAYLLYNITTSTSATALFSHSNLQWRWVGFAEGKSAIYAAGYAGDKSLIYRIRVKPDGTTLDQPVVAGELPDGEIIRSIGGYLGFIMLGTDKGWRFCVPNVSGDLEVGPLVATPAAVLSFEGQDRYVWFGYTNYNGTSTGLGRMNLTQFTENGLPAYASDLMVTTQGAVKAVATFQNLRVFTVAGHGVYAEWTNKVASGTLESGHIGFGIPDTKTAIYADTRTAILPTGASWEVALAADGGSYTTLGTETTAGDTGTQFDADNIQGERFELRYTLTRATDTTDGPTISRYTLKAFPSFADATGAYIYVPVLLHSRCELPNGTWHPFDVAVELTEIKTLRASRALVVYQEGNLSYTVTVDDYEWMPYRVPNGEGITPDGTCLLKLRVF